MGTFVTIIATMKKTFEINEKLWVYPGKAAWHFITLPTDVGQEIDFYFGHQKKGWGSLPVHVTIGQTTWKTSIFPDKKSGSYVLPIKAAVREKESLQAERVVTLSLEVDTLY